MADDGSIVLSSAFLNGRETGKFETEYRARLTELTTNTNISLY